LIADSGSTKTDWAFMGKRVQTQGINPFHQDEDTIRSILKEELLPQLTSDITHLTSILFYGSGVRPELEEKMQRLLQEVFPHLLKRNIPILHSARSTTRSFRSISISKSARVSRAVRSRSTTSHCTVPLLMRSEWK
jgi:hypothetical protein